MSSLTQYVSKAIIAPLLMGGAGGGLLSSCYNADREFPDYEGGTTAYFAYQDPVRTIFLGNDIYDNSLDRAHKFRIWSTMGGAYGGRNATVDFVVDETLCNDLYYVDEGGNPSTPVLPMPKEYYQLQSNAIPYNGDHRGYVEVQLTDAFFNDEKSIENTYVIPLVMTKANGIDHILTGMPREGMTPSRTNPDGWEILPMDYVLYCVKYHNPWHAKYIRRGVDNVTKDGAGMTFIRRDNQLVNTEPGTYTENPVNQYDEVCGIVTKNMKQAIFPVSFLTSTKANMTPEEKAAASVACDLILTFDGDKCTISTDDENVTVSGSGEFIEKGTEKSEYKDFQWGTMNGKPVQRDILRLEYQVSFDDKNIQVATKDTLVVQTRESNKKEFFKHLYVKP